MTPEVLTALIAGILTLLGAIIKQHYDYKSSSKKQENLASLITDTDKRQDEEMKEVRNKLDIVVKYVDKVEYKENLLLKIKKNCNYIVTISNLDNSELILLLNNTRNKYVNIIENILNTKVEDLCIEDIEMDIKTLANDIKMATVFEKIDVLEPTLFYDRLKKEIVTQNMKLFIMRLEEEIISDSNKYNGTFEKITLSIASNLISDIIKVYRKSKAE